VRQLLAGLLLALAGGAAAATGTDPPPEPFAPNTEIRRLARQIRALPGGTDKQLRRIVELIFDEKKGLGFTYRRRPTLTATEAYEARQGNCLSLVNLFVAFARSAGIDARFVAVEDFQIIYRHQGVIVRSNHVIGMVRFSGNMVTVDFLPERPKRYRRFHEISDRRASALFYNAVGVEAMLGGDLSEAERLLNLAFDDDPAFGETWNNYAILLNRQNDAAGARSALEKALELDPELLPAMENLSGVYRRAGELELAEKTDTRILELKTKNPYFLLQQGLLKIREGELDEAQDLLTRARRIESEIPETYLALGRIELRRGNHKEANRLFDQARDKSAAFSERFQTGLQNKINRLLQTDESDS
jgi:tetratricopeptide (TPR) repeat protein